MKVIPLAGLLGLVGVACLCLFEYLGAEVGAQGELHEAFAWQATGMLLLLVAGGVLAVDGVLRCWRYHRGRSLEKLSEVERNK